MIAVAPLIHADGTNNTNAPSAQGEIKPYPLKTCIVSGEKLGEMGDPVRFVYQGQEMKFCCDECVGKFKKNPDKYLKKLEEAKKKQNKAGV